MIAPTDPFLSNELCVERLYKEYTKHKKLIVAVDYDDTLFDWHNNGTTHELVINLMKRCKAIGFYVVVFTASNKERHEAIRTDLLTKGIEIDSINKNPIDLPYGNEGKIYYNIFLCDRAGLRSSYYILEQVVTRVEQETRKRIYLEAPYYYDGRYSRLDSIFLAGSITGAVNWQKKAVDLLNDKFDIFNPRRENIDINDPEQIEIQIKWEHKHLIEAASILFWFSDETLAPITLFELGNYYNKANYIGIHPNYKRRLDVEIQMKLRGHYKFYYDLDEMLADILNKSA